MDRRTDGTLNSPILLCELKQRGSLRSRQALTGQRSSGAPSKGLKLSDMQACTRAHQKRTGAARRYLNFTLFSMRSGFLRFPRPGFLRPSSGLTRKFEGSMNRKTLVRTRRESVSYILRTSCSGLSASDCRQMPS